MEALSSSPAEGKASPEVDRVSAVSPPFSFGSDVRERVGC